MDVGGGLMERWECSRNLSTGETRDKKINIHAVICLKNNENLERTEEKKWPDEKILLQVIPRFKPSTFYRKYLLYSCGLFRLGHAAYTNERMESGPVKISIGYSIFGKKVLKIQFRKAESTVWNGRTGSRRGVKKIYTYRERDEKII